MSTPEFNADFRLGGQIRYCMEMPDGQRVYGGGEVTELDQPRRLVMSDSFFDKDGNPARATDYGLSADWPQNTPISVTLSDNPAGGTHMDIEQSVSAELARSLQCDVSWNQMFDKLEKLLASR